MQDRMAYSNIPGDTFIQKMLSLNSAQEYAIWGSALLVGIACISVARRILTPRLNKSDNNILRLLSKLDSYIYPILYYGVCYVAINALDKPVKVENFLDYTFTVAFVFLTTRLIAAIIGVLIYSYLTHHEASAEKIKQIRGIVLILNGVIWAIAMILLFDNLGFNVTAVLTGLGVGGIAIALAAQTILGDIFNYFVIFFDKPFEVGDFIIVDDKMGVVEMLTDKFTDKMEI